MHSDIGAVPNSEFHEASTLTGPASVLMLSYYSQVMRTALFSIPGTLSMLNEVLWSQFNSNLRIALICLIGEYLGELDLE